MRLFTNALCSIPKSSYYDKNYKQSPALIRARRPYLVKNMITGVGIFAFTMGVCMCTPFFSGTIPRVLIIPSDALTIRAVAQDEFEDVIVPDAPKKSTPQ